jgi:hypothetical protein
LEDIAGQYLASYLRHAPEALPAAPDLRFSENGVLLDLPDGSWDTVTEIVGEPLILSDPQNATAAIFTSVMQSETPGHLAIRLKVAEHRICEVEHILSTRRNLSSPPTPFKDPGEATRDPDFARPVPDGERSSRETMIVLANGHFSTAATVLVYVLVYRNRSESICLNSRGNSAKFASSRAHQRGYARCPPPATLHPAPGTTARAPAFCLIGGERRSAAPARRWSRFNSSSRAPS